MKRFLPAAQEVRAARAQQDAEKFRSDAMREHLQQTALQVPFFGPFLKRMMTPEAEAAMNTGSQVVAANWREGTNFDAEDRDLGPRTRERLKQADVELDYSASLPTRNRGLGDAWREFISASPGDMVRQAGGLYRDLMAAPITNTAGLVRGVNEPDQVEDPDTQLLGPRARDLLAQRQFQAERERLRGGPTPQLTEEQAQRLAAEEAEEAGQNWVGRAVSGSGKNLPTLVEDLERRAGFSPEHAMLVEAAADPQNLIEEAIPGGLAFDLVRGAARSGYRSLLRRSLDNAVQRMSPTVPKREAAAMQEAAAALPGVMPAPDEDIATEQAIRAAREAGINPSARQVTEPKLQARVHQAADQRAEPSRLRQLADAERALAEAQRRLREEATARRLAEAEADKKPRFLERQEVEQIEAARLAEQARLIEQSSGQVPRGALEDVARQIDEARANRAQPSRQRQPEPDLRPARQDSQGTGRVEEIRAERQRVAQEQARLEARAKRPMSRTLREQDRRQSERLAYRAMQLDSQLDELRGRAVLENVPASKTSEPDPLQALRRQDDLAEGAPSVRRAEPERSTGQPAPLPRSSRPPTVAELGPPPSRRQPAVREQASGSPPAGRSPLAAAANRNAPDRFVEGQEVESTSGVRGRVEEVYSEDGQPWVKVRTEDGRVQERKASAWRSLESSARPEPASPAESPLPAGPERPALVAQESPALRAAQERVRQAEERKARLDQEAARPLSKRERGENTRELERAEDDLRRARAHQDRLSQEPEDDQADLDEVFADRTAGSDSPRPRRLSSDLDERSLHQAPDGTWVARKRNDERIPRAERGKWQAVDADGQPLGVGLAPTPDGAAALVRSVGPGKGVREGPPRPSRDRDNYSELDGDEPEGATFADRTGPNGRGSQKAQERPRPAGRSQTSPGKPEGPSKAAGARQAPAAADEPGPAPLVYKGQQYQLGGMDVVRRVETPELVELVRELSGSVPTVNPRLGKNTRGQFVAKGKGLIQLNPEIFKNVDQAAKTLAHEIGHLVDYLPEGILKRGNIIGHLKSLHKFMRVKYGQLLNKELRAELEALSAWWRPIPANADAGYRRYRNQASELFADAISVMLNDVAEFQRRAPKFAAALGDSLDSKPEVKDALVRLYDMLNGAPEAVAARRSQQIRGGFLKGDDLWKAMREEAKLKKENWVERFRQMVDDINYPILRRISELESRGQLEQAAQEALRSLRFTLDENTMLESQAYRLLDRVAEEVVDPLNQAGLNTMDLGEYMFLRRIEAGDRGDLANPWGHTPDTAADGLADMRDRLGADSFEAIEDADRRFHELTHEVNKLAHQVGLISDEMWEKTIQPNRGTYATFAVLDYLKDYVPAGIAQQSGTFKEIANPFTATVMKTLSLQRAVRQQMARQETVQMLLDHFPDEVTRAEAGGMPGTFRGAPKGFEQIHMKENGQTVAYNVDPYVALALDNWKPAELGLVLRIVKGLAEKITFFDPALKALWISLNPFFHAFNFVRDLGRTATNLHALGVVNLYSRKGLKRFVKAYVKAIRPAFKRARGHKDKILDEMLDNFSLAPPGEAFRVSSEDDQFSALLRQHRLLAEPENPTYLKKAVTPLVKIGNGIEGAGHFLEMIPKIAADDLLREAGFDRRAAAYVVRNQVGTPNYNRKGIISGVTNRLFAFSNIIKEGLKTDLQLAFSRRSAMRPNTASGWWMMTAKQAFLPKILMAAGGAGYFGAEVKEAYDRMSETDKTNYICVPMGFQEGGDHGRKVVMLRIPLPETQRLFGALFWKGLHAHKNGPEKAIEGVLDIGAGQMPGLSPTLQLAGTWGAAATGQNPRDHFRGRDIIPKRDFEAGGWQKWRNMVTWQLQQLGPAGYYVKTFAFDDRSNTTLELTTKLGAEKFVKVTDYGMVEKQRAELAAEDRERARRLGSYGPSVQKVRAEFYRLQSLKDQRTEAQQDRYEELKAFEYSVFRPLDEAVYLYQQDGNEEGASAERKALEEAAGDFLR